MLLCCFNVASLLFYFSSLWQKKLWVVCLSIVESENKSYQIFFIILKKILLRQSNIVHAFEFSNGLPSSRISSFSFIGSNPTFLDCSLLFVGRMLVPKSIFLQFALLTVLTLFTEPTLIEFYIKTLHSSTHTHTHTNFLPMLCYSILVI